MADDQGLIQFLSSWNELTSDCKDEVLREFEFKPLPQFQPPSHVFDPVSSATRSKQVTSRSTGPPDSAQPLEDTKLRIPEDSTETRDGIQLHLYYSYLFYYPTIHWRLGKVPETEDYWIGVYEAGAANNEYITYLWIGRAAEGSYDIGCLNVAAGKPESDLRQEKFELRLFNGDCRITDVETNMLLGTVLHAHNGDTPEAHLPDHDTVKLPHAFFTDIHRIVQQSGDIAPKPWGTLRDRQLQLWDKLSSSEQQLLYPFLENYRHSDSVKDPRSRPEPKLCFGSCSKSISGRDATTNPRLTFEIQRSVAYIYPAVNVTEAIPSAYAYMGLSETKSNLQFTGSDIRDPYRRVYIGEGEKSAMALKYIKMDTSGPMDADSPVIKQYLGVIFDKSSLNEDYVMKGLASHTILVAVTLTEPEIPLLPRYSISAAFPQFDKSVALRYARLSELAYEDYTQTLKDILQKDFDLSQEMRIYDERKNTQGFIVSNSSTVVVAFGGTNILSYKHFLTNLWFIPQEMKIDNHKRGVKVHGGFLDVFNAIYEEIEKALLPSFGNKTIFMTGHSLGGALASLLAYRISHEHKDAKLAVYVYGCPPFGNRKFANYFHCLDSNTITIEGDFISAGIVRRFLEFLPNFFKPEEVKFLESKANCLTSHTIAQYIEQLK